MNDSVLIHRAFTKQSGKIADLSDDELISACQRSFNAIQNICECNETLVLDHILMESLFYHYYLLELDRRGITPP